MKNILVIALMSIALLSGTSHAAEPQRICKLDIVNKVWTCCTESNSKAYWKDGSKQICYTSKMDDKAKKSLRETNVVPPPPPPPPPGPGGGHAKGNNGHGNDNDHNDNSNPGNSNSPSDNTDQDGTPGNGNGNSSGNGNGNGKK